MKNLKNKFIKIISVSVISSFLFFGVTTKISAVVTELYTGGLRLVTIQCTCSSASMVLVYDYYLKTVLNLVYLPGFSRLFLNNNIYSSTNILGSYDPSIGAGICLFTAGTTCVDASVVGLPAYGTLDFFPGTGTTLK